MPSRVTSATLFVILAAAACAAQSAEMLTTVTVTDARGAAVTGLPRDAFLLSDGKATQEVTSFAGADGPASVAILFDLSGSVRNGKALGRLNDAIEALSGLARAGHAENEYSVATFSEEVTPLLEAARGPGRAEEALRAVFGAQVGRQSSLFDACWLTIPRLARGAHARRVLVLVTDGVDTYSRAREDDVTRQLKETNVVVYSLNVGALGQTPAVAGRDEGEKVLERLSKVSGGLALAARDAKGAGSAVERVAAGLRGQYVVGFRPSAPPAPGKCLKLKTTVTPPAGTPELSVRAREEFCAPRADLKKK